MKILQVIDLFGAAHGGAAEVPYQLSRELVRRGHEVTVYASDFRLEPERLVSVQQAEVHAFKTFLPFANFYITPGIIWKAREEVGNFDLVHMHQYRSFQNLAVYHYAQKYEVPYVVQAHGSLPAASRAILKRAVDNLWGYKLLRDAAAVLAVTEFEAGQYESMGVSRSKIRIVPHGIDLAEFDNLPKAGTFRATYGLEGKKVVLYLGRINRIKGLDLLARAFAGLSVSMRDAALVFVGPDDGYRWTLERIINDLDIGDKVLFSGPLFGRQKLEAYIDADVYVLPSSYEIFGITILEALACGTPVVVTDRCGLAPAVNGQGALVVPFEEEPLQEALSELLRSGRLRKELGEKGKALVRRDYTWQKIAGEVEEIYKSLL
ncbi:MAG: glycosyltransferase [Chloroflexi bacterium]|nr:glycosyltransferase [Chloroflexota bacterium]